jgi:hypothetical protein
MYKTTRTFPMHQLYHLLPSSSHTLSSHTLSSHTLSSHTLSSQLSLPAPTPTFPLNLNPPRNALSRKRSPGSVARALGGLQIQRDLALRLMLGQGTRALVGGRSRRVDGPAERTRGISSGEGRAASSDALAAQEDIGPGLAVGVGAGWDGGDGGLGEGARHLRGWAVFPLWLSVSWFSISSSCLDSFFWRIL